MRSDEEVEAVLALVAAGLTDSEISRRTGISRTTVRGWRTDTQRTTGKTSHYGWDRLPRAAYSYLLGLYLGDGTISCPAFRLAGRG